MALSYEDTVKREHLQLEITRDILIAAIAAKSLPIALNDPEKAATAIGTMYQKLFALVKSA